MRVAFWIAVVPALLGTTAVVAQDGFFAAGLSIGGGAIKLPSGQNGVLTLGDVTVTGNPDPLLPAGTLGFNAAAGLGKWGEYDAYAGLNLFATYGAASWSGTQAFSGIGTVYIPGMSLPDNGSIELHTTRGFEVGVASSDVTGTSPQGNTDTIAADASTNGVGSQSDAAVTGSPLVNPNSFVVGGTNTSVDGAGATGTALAYGGIADTSGSLLIITGDLAGLSISTQTSTQVLYAGGDMTVGVSKVQDETTALQAYAGPSYRFLGQWSNTTIGATQLSVNIPEEASPTVHPLWDQTTTFNTALNSHYFGGVLGAGVSKQVSDKVSVSAGAELSGYYTLANLNGRGSVRTHGGVAPTDPPVDPDPGVASPDITVVQDPVNVLTNTLAFAARAQASATYAVADNVGLTVAGSVDYLSAVARPYGGAAVTGSGGNASWSSASGDNSAVSFGDMFVFTGTVTLSGQF